MKTGNLRFNVVEAKLTRDTEVFGKMDPFVELVTPLQKVRTRTIDGAGKTPKWNTVFDITVKDPEHQITISVFDEDSTTNDEVSKTFSK